MPIDNTVLTDSDVEEMRKIIQGQERTLMFAEGVGLATQYQTKPTINYDK